MPITVAIGSDHAGFEYKKLLKPVLESHKFKIHDFGTYSSDSADYPTIAIDVAQAIAKGDYDFGILICGTGIGMSIVANKVTGIRAALCMTEEMAQLARNHNNANILTLGSRIIDFETAKKISIRFLKSEFFETEIRHSRRVQQIHSLTKR
jgi:ribose 5-phosphate isomerase B